MYGFVWETDYPFVSPLTPAAGSTQVEFVRGYTQPAFGNPTRRYVSDLILCNQPLLDIQDSADGLLLRYPSFAAFTVSLRRIQYIPKPGGDPQLIELHFLGAVTALWLELNGLPALHASAVVVNGRAVVFMEHSGGGKSTLAATFLQRRHALLTDDVLAVSLDQHRAFARPGYPQLRLSSKVADRFLNPAEALPCVHPKVRKRRIPVGEEGIGRFCTLATPISRIYLPDRVVDDNATLGIRRLAPSEAVIELARGSFAARSIEPLGLQPGRLAALAQLAESVTVCRLTYPSGMCYLGQVYEEVMQDVCSDSNSD